MQRDSPFPSPAGQAIDGTGQDTTPSWLLGHTASLELYRDITSKLKGCCFPQFSQNELQWAACFDSLLINAITVCVIFSAASKSMLDCLPF